jgi:hypothetical protein
MNGPGARNDAARHGSNISCSISSSIFAFRQVDLPAVYGIFGATSICELIGFEVLLGARTSSCAPSALKRLERQCASLFRRVLSPALPASWHRRDD